MHLPPSAWGVYGPEAVLIADTTFLAAKYLLLLENFQLFLHLLFLNPCVSHEKANAAVLYF